MDSVVDAAAASAAVKHRPHQESLHIICVGPQHVEANGQCCLLYTIIHTVPLPPLLRMSNLKTDVYNLHQALLWPPPDLIAVCYCLFCTSFAIIEYQPS